MKTCNRILLLTASFLIAATGLYADNEKPAPDTAIGIIGFYGYSDLTPKNMDVDINPGICGGGGLVIEKMFSNSFGIHTGIEYEYSRINFLNNTGTESYWATWNFHKAMVPLLLITSLNTEPLSVNFLAGINYSSIFRSHMKTNTEYTIETHNDNAMKYVSSHQFGVSGGINFKLRFTKFTEMFVGVLGDYYFTNVLDNRKDSNDQLHIYEVRCITGWMFRTNIFPMEDD